MPRRPRGTAKATFFWLVPAAFGVHIAEELPRFPRWATRHFGTTSTRFYVASHCLLGPAVIACCAAGAKNKSWKGPFAGAAAASVMVVNTLYHVGTTALFREYSPGVVTAVLGLLPTGLAALKHTRDEGLLTDEQLVGAILVGNAACLAAVGSLYIDMPTLGGKVED